jgi:DNA invertase Pin-like site-specific DNA recombinase
MKGQRLRMLGYLRVSSQGQARSGLGEAAQRANIEGAAEREGWDIVWLVDHQSGKDTSRPAFKQALQLIADHEVEGLCAAKLDRIARSVQDFSQLASWFVAGGKILAVCDPWIDTASTNGRLVANVLASVAEWEREVIAGRTSDSLQALRASGKPICRASVVDDVELVARIQALREDELSYQAIADELNRLGVPTLRGGSEWRVSSIQSALGYRRPPRQHRAPNLPLIKRRKRAA